MILANAYLSSDFLTGVHVGTDLETYFDNIPDRSPVDGWLALKRDIINEGETIGSAEFLFSKARIEIEDNGSGMDAAVCKRIFEPFFTTKPLGVGTGLGLSVSYFIVTENHGGTLSVSSTPGVGSRFVIRLPVSNAHR